MTDRMSNDRLAQAATILANSTRYQKYTLLDIGKGLLAEVKRLRALEPSLEAERDCDVRAVAALLAAVESGDRDAEYEAVTALDVRFADRIAELDGK